MRKLLNILLRPMGVELVKAFNLKTKARHEFVSLAYSIDNPKLTNNLISTVAKGVELAWNAEVDTSVANTSSEDFQHFNTFPGEHYRLLKAICKHLTPRMAVEIGTYTGMGSIALMQGLPDNAQLHTFDIRDWQSLPTHLHQNYFDQGKITQHLCDLSETNTFARYREILEQADLIFCDGPKDGRFEYKFLDHLQEINARDEFKLLILDDIRFPNMIDLWRSIKSPKIDISSLGHFSGTGLVDISSGLKLKKN